jgi:hypothetical protein
MRSRHSSGARSVWRTWPARFGSAPRRPARRGRRDSHRRTLTATSTSPPVPSRPSPRVGRRRLRGEEPEESGLAVPFIAAAHVGGPPWGLHGEQGEQGVPTAVLAAAASPPTSGARGRRRGRPNPPAEPITAGLSSRLDPTAGAVTSPPAPRKWRPRTQPASPQVAPGPRWIACGPSRTGSAAAESDRLRSELDLPAVRVGGSARGRVGAEPAPSRTSPSRVTALAAQITVSVRRRRSRGAVPGARTLTARTRRRRRRMPPRRRSRHTCLRGPSRSWNDRRARPSRLRAGGRSGFEQTGQSGPSRLRSQGP